MKKRSIILLLALALVLGISSAAMADTIANGTCGAEGDGYNLTWTLYDDSKLVISGTGIMADYGRNNRPPWYDYCDDITSVFINDGVTSIGDWAFAHFYELTEVTIPEGLTCIGDDAFAHCTSLTIMTIPDSVTIIGDEVFCNCSSLTSVNIPNGVTNIGRAVFFRTSLTSVTIPDSVTSIGNTAFYDCNNLISVKIGNGVTSIGDEAFCYCYRLTRVTIPDDVISIGNGAFYLCDNLTDAYYGGTEAQWNEIIIGTGNNCLTDANIHFTEIGYTVTLDNRTEGNAHISGITIGNTYSGDVTFTVSCDDACLVLYTVNDDDDHTYSRLTAREEGNNSYSFTVNVNTEITIAVIMIGDVNCDGEVNTTDVAQVKRYIAKRRAFDAVELAAANVIDSDEVNTTDVAQIKRFIAGRRTFSW